jgi:hypothetical protein
LQDQENHFRRKSCPFLLLKSISGAIFFDWTLFCWQDGGPCTNPGNINGQFSQYVRTGTAKPISKKKSDQTSSVQSLRGPKMLYNAVKFIVRH